MRKKLSFLLLAGMLVVCLLVPGSVEAVDIIWIHQPDAGGDFDIGFTDFLTANGHTVTRDGGYFQDGGRTIPAGGPYDPLATSSIGCFGAGIDLLNAADLIIISIMTSSGRYDSGTDDGGIVDQDRWNDITTPIIVMSNWLARGGTQDNRLEWTNETMSVDQGGVPVGAEVTFTDTSHPLFIGLASPFVVSATWVGDKMGEIPVANEPNATVLGRLAGFPVDQDAYILSWEPGVQFFAGTVVDAAHQLPQEKRLLMPMGGSNVAPSSEGFFNLSPDGETLLLNAVNWLAGPPPPPPATPIPPLGVSNSLLYK